MAETLSRRDLSIDGTPVQIFDAYDDCEQTEPLVLFNGIGTTNETWGRFPELIDTTTIAIDMSKSVDKLIPSMNDYAKVAMNVLDELELKRVNALGLSWGTLLTQEMALRHPERFGRLILAGGAIGVTVPPKPRAAILLALPNRSPSYIQKHSQSIYGGDAAENAEIAGSTVRDINHAHYRRQQIAALSCVRNYFKQVYRFSTIDSPTLIMYGDDDPISQWPNSYAMRMLIRNSQLHEVKKGGHLFLITRPEESAKTVNGFLNQEN